jgi:hypothetical protein
MEEGCLMRRIRNAEYTNVIVLDEAGQGNANHKYEVVLTENRNVVACAVNFQNGPIQENGVNGVQNEDLLAIVIHRLQGFQSGNFACRENAIALTKIQEALMWLEKRTADRKARGIEGKNVK